MLLTALPVGKTSHRRLSTRAVLADDVRYFGFNVGMLGVKHCSIDEASTGQKCLLCDAIRKSVTKKVLLLDYNRRRLPDLTDRVPVNLFDLPSPNEETLCIAVHEHWAFDAEFDMCIRTTI